MVRDTKKLDKKLLDSIALPKWPALVVRGERVEPLQAAEIIIRTDSYYWYSSSNNKGFDREFCRLFGAPYCEYFSGRGDLHPCRREGRTRKQQKRDAEVLNALWRAKDRLARRLKMIWGLNYLHNSRICSSWVGGPHGWCDWTGSIQTTCYNIGKWPDCSEVLRDWRSISRAFPYLRLRAQLFSGEQCEEGTYPVIEYLVEGGRAWALEPESNIGLPTDSPYNPATFLAPGFEVGVTIEQLKSFIEKIYGRVPQLYCPEYRKWLTEEAL